MADVLNRLSRALADRYAVEREIGRGGMAVVYLAKDLRHERQVALKVFLPDLAGALGPERFLAEIRIAANLNHPHVLPLYDSGEVEGLLFYVMPYVEGESLRDRLDREKQLPIDDALQLAREVADALSYAHAQGVVHRDIKPENILLASGHAVVADFGIARAIDAAGGEHLTRTGIALGTPAYMSPEQATGERDLDGRSDLYSLGCVLYEMLAGRPPFTGPTNESVALQHVSAELPRITAIRPSVPGWVAAALERSLSKTPADRFNPVAQFGEALSPHAPTTEWSGSGAPPVSARAGGRRTRSWPWLRWLVPGLLVIGAVALALLSRREGPRGLTLGDAWQVTADDGLEVHPAISPDGNLVAYAAGAVNRMEVFVRPVDGGRAIRLAEGVSASQTHPRWSPDGTEILFLAGGAVHVVSALGGPARVTVPRGATSWVTSADWSPDGDRIAFVRGDTLQVAHTGGGSAPVPLVSADLLHSCVWAPSDAAIACVEGNSAFVWPGGNFGNLAPSRIVLVPPTGGPLVAVTDAGSLHQSPSWSSDGRLLLYVSNEKGPRDVYGVRVSDRGEVQGDPVRLTVGLNAQSVDVAATARRLVYSVYAARSNIWSLPIPTDPPATIEGAEPLTSGSQVIESMQVSPDGEWLLYDSNVRGNADIYRIPLRGGTPEQLTREPFDEFGPSLSPDGRTLAYFSWETGSRDIVVRDLEGGRASRLTSTPSQESYPVWSPEGSRIAFFDQAAGAVATYVLEKDPTGSWSDPRRIAADLQRPSWAPDGTALAVEGGVGSECGLAVVPAAGGEARCLYEPGQAPEDLHPRVPTWSSDGRTIYFKSLDQEGVSSFWSVPARGGQPRLLVRFDDPARPSTRADYATDGSRFYFALVDRQSDIWVVDVVE